MGQIVIYGLHRPGRDIFYVGKTNSLKRRLKEHRRWLKGKIEVIVLEIVDSSEWKAAEHAWIQTFRELGLTMANKTEGGDGAETLSAELKAAISARQTGRKASEETRKRMSAAQKGKRKNWTLDGLERASATRIQPGTKPWNIFTPDMTEEEKEAIRERIRSGQTEETIARLAATTAENSRNAWAKYTPEQRAERVQHVSDGHLRRPKEDRIKTASAGGLALAAKDPGAASRRVRTWWAQLTPEERESYLAKRTVAIREGHAKKKAERELAKHG